MKITNENNAFATIAGGQRILVIDVGFLKSVNGRCGTKWGAISIIAHEVGHHLSNFRGLDGTNISHAKELAADYYSGFILTKLGSSQEAAVKAMKLIGSDADSQSHPARNTRVDSIINGWNDGQ